MVISVVTSERDTGHWARLPWEVTAALCLLMTDKVRTVELTFKFDNTEVTGDLDTH